MITDSYSLRRFAILPLKQLCDHLGPCPHVFQILRIQRLAERMATALEIFSRASSTGNKAAQDQLLLSLSKEVNMLEGSIEDPLPMVQVALLRVHINICQAKIDTARSMSTTPLPENIYALRTTALQVVNLMLDANQWPQPGRVLWPYSLYTALPSALVCAADL
jgi:hypothetical protein